MDKSDLEAYQVQLTHVEVALSGDPGNAELSSLRDELKELIQLTKAAIAQSEAVALTSKEGSSSNNRKLANSTPTHKWSAGDDCFAKFSGDGQWYPARITSVGGSTETPVFSIVFKGYNTTELVKGSEIKPLPPNYNQIANVNSAAAGKRKLSKAEEEEKEKKKKKNEKKLEVRAQKAKEQLLKQQTWQKFAKKSEKKGVHIAGVAGTSIFKTPDNPLGKGACVFCCLFLFLFLLVCLFANTDFFSSSFFCCLVGVTGSGKGMTEVAMKQKHKFEVREDDQ